MAKTTREMLKAKAWVAYIRYIKLRGPENGVFISSDAYEEFGDSKKLFVSYQEIRTKYIALYDELMEARGL